MSEESSEPDSDAVLERDIVSLMSEAVDVYERCAVSIVSNPATAAAAVVATILTTAAELGWAVFQDQEPARLQAKRGRRIARRVVAETCKLSAMSRDELLRLFQSKARSEAALNEADDIWDMLGPQLTSAELLALRIAWEHAALCGEGPAELDEVVGELLAEKGE